MRNKSIPKAYIGAKLIRDLETEYNRRRDEDIARAYGSDFLTDDNREEVYNYYDNQFKNAYLSKGNFNFENGYTHGQLGDMKPEESGEDYAHRVTQRLFGNQYVTPIENTLPTNPSPVQHASMQPTTADLLADFKDDTVDPLSKKGVSQNDGSDISWMKLVNKANAQLRAWGDKTTTVRTLDEAKAYQRDILGLTGDDIDGDFGNRTRAAYMRKFRDPINKGDTATPKSGGTPPSEYRVYNGSIYSRVDPESKKNYLYIKDNAGGYRQLYNSTKTGGYYYDNSYGERIYVNKGGTPYKLNKPLNLDDTDKSSVSVAKAIKAPVDLPLLSNRTYSDTYTDKNGTKWWREGSNLHYKDSNGYHTVKNYYNNVSSGSRIGRIMEK